MLWCCNQQTDKGIYDSRQNRNINRIWNNVKKDLKQMGWAFMLNVLQKRRLWQRNNTTTGSGSLFFPHRFLSVIVSKINVVNMVYQCIKACCVYWFDSPESQTAQEITSESCNLLEPRRHQSVVNQSATLRQRSAHSNVKSSHKPITHLGWALA